MDISYLLFLQNMREATNGIFNPFMAYITTYGEELLTMMIVAAIYWCVDKNQGIYTMMTWGTGRLVNGFLKVTACGIRLLRTFSCAADRTLTIPLLSV